jgi:hypothetical protein
MLLNLTAYYGSFFRCTLIKKLKIPEKTINRPVMFHILRDEELLERPELANLNLKKQSFLGK